MPTLISALERALETTVQKARQAALRSIIRKAETKIAAVFARQGREFLSRFAKERSSFPAAEGFREATTEGWEKYFTQAELETLAAFNGAIDEATRRALEAGIKVAIAELALDKSFAFEGERAEAFLKGRAAERVAMINDTTRAELRTLLARAMEEGWSYDKTAKAIKEQFEGFAGRRPQKHIQSRAHLVATTEAGDAYEEGNLQVGRQLKAAGLEMEKSWLTVGDDRVSDRCRTDQGAGWIAIDDQFPSGNDRPPGHVACRCCGLYRRKPSEA